MKIRKVLSFFLVLLVLFTGAVTVSADTVCGQALHSDIVVYINNYAIPSYIVNGTSVIVAEDLNNYGFNVAWNGNARTLNISKNSSTAVDSFVVLKGAYATGTVYSDLYTTDIKVFAAGHQITSYNMGGYTMIPVEELTMLGKVVWDGGSRTLKMWVDGLHVSNELIGVKAVMFAADGRNKVINFSDIWANQQVGWMLPEAYGNYLKNTHGYATALNTLEAECKNNIGTQNMDVANGYYSQLQRLSNNWYIETGKPVVVTAYSVGREDNEPAAVIKYRNLTGKKIKEIVFRWTCYNSWGGETTDYPSIYNGTIQLTYTTNTAAYEGESLTDILYHNSATTSISAPYITKVTFEDGSVWWG